MSDIGGEPDHRTLHALLMTEVRQQRYLAMPEVEEVEAGNMPYINTLKT